eukprot:7258702-Alexandrium_andersonii.AAC.1
MGIARTLVPRGSRNGEVVSTCTRTAHATPCAHALDRICMQVHANDRVNVKVNLPTNAMATMARHRRDA